MPVRSDYEDMTINVKSLSFAFGSGFLATLLFHQGGLLGLWALGAVPVFPWDLTPVPPLGVPRVLSLAFFGGLWGLPCLFLGNWILKRDFVVLYWLGLTLFGSIFPTLIAMLIVFPMKGIEVSAKLVIGGLILNALWGLGVAIGLKASKVVHGLS